MKIFNRGTETKASAPGQGAAATAPTAPAPAASPATTPPAPAAPAPVAAAPDLAVILDANVKEMSEKIARLASTLESSQTERSGFEAKIEQMDERMRKLSSLTEMISAQYNPFVGDAPAERDAMPRPEVGLAPPIMQAPTMTLPPLPPTAEVPPPPPPLLSLTLEPPAPPVAVAPDFASLPPAPDAFPMMAPPQPSEPTTSVPVAEGPAPEPGIYLWSAAPGFESSMLLLNWADMLLKSAGSRESLLDLVNYYHNIGWIGDPARDQLLAYSDGLTTPTGAPSDWRADVEVHERSLLFVEKLRAVSSRRSS